MKHPIALGLAAALLLCGAAGASHAKTSGGAKITRKQAESIALKRVDGKILEGELEREHGLLIYSFDIKTSDGIQEVQVDAKTGKVVSVEAESAQHEAQEKAADAKTPKRHP